MIHQIIVGSSGVYERYAGKFHCPNCRVELYVSRNGANSINNPSFVYCGNGKCGSQAASDGAFGNDVEHAIVNLTISINGIWLK